MPSKKAKRGGGLLLALTFASLFFNHPQNEWIVILCTLTAGSLTYSFSDYPPTGDAKFQRIVRWVFLVVTCGSLSVAWGSYWWERIRISPERLAFRGFADETFNLSERNGMSYDVYDIQIPFLVGYNKHFDDKLSAKTVPNSDPPTGLQMDYSYCYGTKGDGVVSHVQQNEREILIVRIPHLVPSESESFSITYTGGEQFTAKLFQDPDFLEEPTSYSPRQGTFEVRGDYRICKFAMRVDKPTGEK